MMTFRFDRREIAKSAPTDECVISRRSDFRWRNPLRKARMSRNAVRNDGVLLESVWRP
jgi:hypothetical protein